MSKKHFVAIASIFREYRNIPENDDKIRNGMDNASRIIAINLAYVLADTNPRFNRERFLKACGIEGSN